MSWFETLQPAKFGGVPFGVLGGTIRVGRRNAVHEYPFKDQVFVEDLGRSARRITLTGFLVEAAAYGGASSVLQQRELMIAACEAPGQKSLVHPTLGALNVSLIESAFVERWDHGRVFEIAFSFLEAGEREFPASEEDTGTAVAQACTAADAAAAGDFSAAAQSPLAAGAAVVSMVTSTVSSWTSTAQALASDATNLMHSVGSLPGEFGRFFGGNLRDITGSLVGVLADGRSTITSLIATVTVLRTGVSNAISNLLSAATSLSKFNAITFAGSAQALSASVLNATTDPADSVRMLQRLAAFTPAAPTPNTAVGQAMASIQSATGDLFRRAAVVSVARASALYQPFSYDDAAAIRATVAALLDAEAQLAGDQGQDSTYNALRTVRAAVVKDLTVRGADLSRLTTIVTPRPMPALVLAQRLYRDASRADELVVQSGAVHPAFMPTSFQGLAS